MWHGQESHEFERYLELGLNYFEEGEYDQALECFQKAILLAPEEGEVYYYQGHLFYVQQDYERALECFGSALRLAKQKLEEEEAEEHGPWWADSDTHLYLKTLRAMGAIYYEQGRYEEAIGLFTQLLNLNPQDSLEVRELLVETYLRTGDYASVVEIYQLLEQAFSQKVEEYRQGLREEEDYYKKLFSQHWQNQRAEEEFLQLLREEHRRVLEREALSPISLYNLGLAHFFQGETGQQKERWQKALSQNPYVYYFLKGYPLPPELEERDCPARWQAKEYVERFGDFWQQHTQALQALEQTFCEDTP